MSNRVIAILCSDIHLQAKPPAVRSAEPDWFEAMARPLQEVRNLQQAHASPVLIAGDVFDKWYAAPEVINFAIENLPRDCYTIPGQHDLPYHNYNDMRRTAYGTLVASGRITDLGKTPYQIGKVYVHPFPWGTDITPCDDTRSGIHLALIHKYIWKLDHGYTGAPEDAKVGAYRKQLEGYDVCVFGDNHKGFMTNRRNQYILNCGGFMRRKIDEIKYQPHIGLLYEDGTVQRHALDCSQDMFIDTDRALLSAESRAIDMHDFMDELSKLGAEGLDFVEAVERYISDNKIEDRPAAIMRSAIS